MAFISLNAKYQPLSFEEYIAPYVAHQQAYEKYTQGLEDLATDASKYAQYIPKDSQAYATQQKYLEGLKNASDVLYNEGMNINNNFNTVRALRKQYTDEILPINSAAQRLGALTDLASQYEAKGLRTFNMPSIDQLVQDGTLTFKTYSPDKIKQEGMLYGTTLLSNSPTKRYLQKIAGDPYHNVLISENKLDPGVYQDLMSDPTNNKAVVSALSTQGITPKDSVFNEAAQQYILGVIEGSARKEQSQVLADEGAKAGLDVWKYRKQKEIDAEYAAKNGNSGSGKLSKKDIEELGNNIKNLLSGHLNGIIGVTNNIESSNNKVYLKKAAKINNTKDVEKIGNHIKNHAGKNKIQNIENNKNIDPDDIDKFTEFGGYYDSNKGFQPYAVVLLNNGKKTTVRIAPDIINTDIGTKLTNDYNQLVNSQGGYDRFETERMKNRNKYLPKVTEQIYNNPANYYNVINDTRAMNTLYNPLHVYTYRLYDQVLQDVYKTPTETKQE